MESKLEIERQYSTSAKAQFRAAEGEVRLQRRLRLGEEVIRAILLFCGVVSIFTTIGIIYVLTTESARFLNARAWVFSKAPVVAETSTATLEQTIPVGENVLVVNFDSETIPFADRQLIQINDEIMRIESRTRRTLTVQRAQEGTAAGVHNANAEVFIVNEVQVKPTAPVGINDTQVQIPAYAAAEFAVNDLILIGQEVMRITAISETALTVERGLENSPIREIPISETINYADHPGFIEFFTTTNWQPSVGEFGVLPLVTSTLMTSIVALFVAIPMGLGAAIYLSEYAPPNVRNTLKPILEVLAGVPTVVYGFFALTFMTPLLKAIFGDQVQSFNMLSAGLVVGILITPLISSMCEDAISAVPRALREASYGLGATKFETTIKVVLPAALSGVLAAIIVATSRAVGETMVVALAAGQGPNFTFNLFQSAETMTGHIARISSGDISQTNIAYDSIFAIGMLLFVLTLVLNLISSYVSERLRERY
ncbi:MAG: phosphate ABC transporter permease subunit PstC [Anaerolineae bacterium]|nr:phosphate ABC transporter permease subunit PstC [Anaerolineae bacterium]